MLKTEAIRSYTAYRLDIVPPWCPNYAPNMVPNADLNTHCPYKNPLFLHTKYYHSLPDRLSPIHLERYIVDIVRRQSKLQQ